MSLDPKIVLHGNKVAAGQAIRAARILLDGQMRKDAAYGIPVSKVRYVLPTGQIVIATHEYGQTYLDISASLPAQKYLNKAAKQYITGVEQGYAHDHIIQVGDSWTNQIGQYEYPGVITGGWVYADNGILVAGGPIAAGVFGTATGTNSLGVSTYGISPSSSVNYLRFKDTKNPNSLVIDSPVCPFGEVLVGQSPLVYIGANTVMGVATAPGSWADRPASPAAGQQYTNEMSVPFFVSYKFDPAKPGNGVWAKLADVKQYTPDQLISVTYSYLGLPPCPQIAYPSMAVSFQSAQVAETITAVSLRLPTISGNPYWYIGPILNTLDYTWGASSYLALTYNTGNPILATSRGSFVYIGYAQVSGTPSTEYNYPSGAMVGFPQWSIAANVYYTFCSQNTSTGAAGAPPPYNYPPTSTPKNWGASYSGGNPPPSSFYSKPPYPFVLTTAWDDPAAKYSVNPVPQTPNNNPPCGTGFSGYSYASPGIDLTTNTYSVQAPLSDVDPYNGGYDYTYLYCLNYTVSPTRIAVGDASGISAYGTLFAWMGTGYTTAALHKSVDGGASWAPCGPSEKYTKYMGFGRNTGWSQYPALYPEPAAGVIYAGSRCVLAWSASQFSPNANGSDDPQYIAETVESGAAPAAVDMFWSEDMGGTWSTHTVQVSPSSSPQYYLCYALMMGLGEAMCSVPGTGEAVLFSKGKTPSNVSDPLGLIPNYAPCDPPFSGFQTPFWTGPVAGVFGDAGGSQPLKMRVQGGVLACYSYPWNSSTYNPPWWGGSGFTVLGGHGKPYAYMQGVYAVP